MIDSQGLQAEWELKGDAEEGRRFQRKAVTCKEACLLMSYSVALPTS